MPAPLALPPTRRLVIAASAWLAAGPALSVAPAGGRLRFTVLRNGAHVGEHQMTFSGDGAMIRAVTEVEMTVKLGPVPVFRYRHEAREQWSDGDFRSLDTATSSNGKREKVIARRSGAAVSIETLKGAVAAPAQAAPLTHWNPEVFRRPLFNPQTGKLLKITASRAGAAPTPGAARSAVRWTLSGDAQIEDWYDEAGVWLALRGRLEDGSIMEYRRI